MRRTSWSTLLATIVAAGCLGCVGTAPAPSQGQTPNLGPETQAPTAEAPSSTGSAAAGRQVIDVGVSGSVTWAITYAGLETTVDQRQSWDVVSPADVKPEQIAAVDLASWPIGSFVAIHGGQTLVLMQTVDGGTTWSSHAIDESFPDGFGRISLQVVDAKTDYLAVTLPSSSAASVGEFLSSGDDGSTWTHRDLPTGGEIAFTSTSAGWLRGGPLDNLLFRTSDAGRTWTPVTVALPASFADHAPGLQIPVVAGEQLVMPVRLFINGGGPLLLAAYTSHDAGKTWELNGTPAKLDDEGVTAPIAESPGYIVAASDEGFVVSTDAGHSFRVLSPSGPNPANIALISVDSNGTFLALEEIGTCATFKTECTTNNTLWRSVDGAASWARVDL
jgi:photosystem II stability/assembly factor-like uncharacterized protein